MSSSSNSSAKSTVNGKRSASLDKHRRQGSVGYKDTQGGGAVMEKLGHVRTRSSGGPSTGITQGCNTQAQSGTTTTATSVPPVVPPPIDRLLPSPPLTPVASVSSLRKAAAKEKEKVKARDKRTGAEVDLNLGALNNSVLKMGKAGKTVARPEAEAETAVERTGRVALSSDAVAEVVGVEQDAAEDGDGVDTEADGALSSSTRSFRPDGVTEISTGLRSHSHSHSQVRQTGVVTKSDTEEDISVDGGGADNDNVNKDRDKASGSAATASTSAVLTALAQPSSSALTGPESRVPRDSISPLPPQEEIEGVRDPLSGNSGDVNGSEAPTSAATGLDILDKSTAGVSSSASAHVPPGSRSSHDASAISSAMPHHPLQSGPSPQPWDLIEPPPSNNAQLELEERLRRIRKDSARSAVPGGEVVDVVVKDGKRYRIPHSSYYFGPPPDTSAFGTDPIGQIGVHHPREIVRVERDYSGGELVQFSPCYPLELEGRITPTQFLETINTINETLLEAHSLRRSFLDNALAVLTLYISRLFVTSHYDRKMQRLKETIEELNKTIYNPAGLNILWPKDVAFMFLEIEYY